MKKIIATLILFIFTANYSLAQTVFYEDFTFYGELVTDIRINKVERHHQIQLAFPSFLPSKIPMILNGEAHYTEVDGKPCIVMGFDQLSIGAGKHIPVKVLVRALNAKKLDKETFVKPNRYFQSVSRVNKYSREVLTYPINRYKYNPTMRKPTKNTFIMLLEPVYAVLGASLYTISPFSAFFVFNTVEPDIKKGTVVEFEFLEEISKKDIEKSMKSEDL